MLDRRRGAGVPAGEWAQRSPIAKSGTWTLPGSQRHSEDSVGSDTAVQTAACKAPSGFFSLSIREE